MSSVKNRALDIDAWREVFAQASKDPEFKVTTHTPDVEKESTPENEIPVE